MELGFHQRMRLEIVLADAQVDRAVSAIRTAAATNTPGDGNIWIQPVADFVRIRDGARGGDALMPAGLPEAIP
jgi:nitrogen regulatory protein P-II 1